MIPELPERARLDLVKTSDAGRVTRERAPGQLTTTSSPIPRKPIPEAFYFYSHFFDGG
jgi:hypothetical protein